MMENNRQNSANINWLTFIYSAYHLKPYKIRGSKN